MLSLPLNSNCQCSRKWLLCTASLNSKEKMTWNRAPSPRFWTLSWVEITIFCEPLNFQYCLLQQYKLVHPGRYTELDLCKTHHTMSSYLGLGTCCSFRHGHLSCPFSLIPVWLHLSNFCSSFRMLCGVCHLPPSWGGIKYSFSLSLPLSLVILTLVLCQLSCNCQFTA